MYQRFALENSFQGQFAIIQHDIIHVTEYTRIAHLAQFGGGVSASENRSNFRVSFPDVLRAAQGREQVARKRQGESYEGRGICGDFVLQQTDQLFFDRIAGLTQFLFQKVE